MSEAQRDEWVRLLTEIAACNRDDYRALRSEAWERLARGHSEKTEPEREIWRANAS